MNSRREQGLISDGEEADHGDWRNLQENLERLHGLQSGAAAPALHHMWPVPGDKKNLTSGDKHDLMNLEFTAKSSLAFAIWFSYLSRSSTFVGVGGSRLLICGAAQPIWFLQYFLNQLLNATTMLSDDVGT